MRVRKEIRVARISMPALSLMVIGKRRGELSTGRLVSFQLAW